MDAVGDLLTQVDEAEAALSRARDEVARFRASLLHAATAGALTAGWRAANPPAETGADLLARILAERRAAWERAERARLEAKGTPPRGEEWKARYVEPSAPSTDDMAPLPDGWLWTSLGQLFDVMIGATPSRANADFWDGEVPWVSSGEVAFCTITHTRERITPKGLSASSTNLHPPGTVLLAMIGEGKTRGQAAILGLTACNNQNAAAIRVAATPIPSLYVYWWLELSYEKSRKASAGGNQPALNKSKVQNIMLPLPSLAELEQLVADIEETADAEVGMQSDLSSATAEISALRQSILHAAFTGRLVPQDPADEPASALLARLRAAPAVPRPRGRRRAPETATPAPPTP